MIPPECLWEKLLTGAWEEVLIAPMEKLVTGPGEILLTIGRKNSLPRLW